MRLGFYATLCLAALAVSGCGGSVSSTSTPPAAPTVTSVTPVSAATGVAPSAAITAVFSETMNASSIGASSFTVSGPGGAVAGTVTYSSSTNTATFTPSASLASGTQYTATITTAATASDGATLAANYSWSFTTAQAPVPTVTAVTPANGTTAVPVNTALTATFSEAMNASSIGSSTFTVSGPSGAVTGTVTYSSSTSTASFTPSSALAYDTQYTATITTGATSSGGAALAANFTWSFTTVGATPAVTAVTPANGATGVSVSSALTATFNEAMNASSLNGAFTLTPSGGSPVAGTVSYNSASSTATFTPGASLASNTTYTASISTAAASSAGVALAQSYSWSFTTAAAPAPTVVSTTPANGATAVSVTQALTATFSTAMNSSTVTTSTFTLSGPSGAVAGIVAYNSGSDSATFTPSASLASSTQYTATITTGAQSSAGTALASNYQWQFTTAAPANAVTVDFGTTYQTIRGFGGSTAWLGKMPQAVASALFSPTSGLGLSILRVRIDPEGSASGGGAHGDPYETSQWDQEAANGLEAVTANPNAIVFATPWTPPAAWKLSGSSSLQDDGETWNQSFNSCGEGNGYCGGYLDPSHYADYANFLEDFVKFFNSTNGFNLYAISMQNEPEENVTYESCVWTPEEMDAWVAGDASTITSDTYHTKLIMPESDVFSPVDAAKALNDPNAEGLISIVGGHIYQVLGGGSITPYSIPAGDTSKELWMTEFGPLSTATPTFSEALTTYAESIHNSLVTGQYNAYVWWGIFGAPTAAGTWGLVDNSGNPTVMGEVMGQYSKFVLPGYVRASATANPAANVYVSAYTGSGHYVIVIINAGTSAPVLGFTLQNAAGVTSLTPYQSTSSGGLVQEQAVSVSGGQFTYTLPAQSITTLVH